MKVWSYHPETKALVSDTPHEAQTIWNKRHLPEGDRERYAIPANSTAVEPPRKRAGKERVFDPKTQTWTHVEDHRGEAVFETATGQPRKIEDLGPLPEEVTPLQPRPFDRWNSKTRTWTEDAGKRAEQEREARIDQARQTALQRVAQAAAAKVSPADIAVALGLREPTL